MGQLEMAWRGAVAAMLLVAAGPAHGFCGGVTRLMMPIEFAPGSAALAPGLAARVQGFAQAHGPAAADIDSIAVTVMGDLGEGAEYDGASTEARAADKALAEARLAAIRAQLDPGKPITDAKLRETRQIFTAEDVARNPMLNDRVRAGLFLSMMVPRGPVKKGEPVPLC
ncbi:hypothetical protein FHS95_003481 [Sphingomonas naasensis]|uniref:Uncharacterized protein n=1 Tax=Sphingomonas naasensis TaxID=1344951 RepID=A0A4S1WHB9_9SPHN|nr:hypothetical protein [Sphingomonas naasensis]NIJ21770.1 hypothetical protein [Sphingomonas naasensis]TGX42524.1 hypothetical protein E5A74_11865 [Sphingomonas naasensis]